MTKIQNIFINYILACLILCFIISCHPTKYIPEGKYLIQKVTVNCDNKAIDHDELDEYIKQKPNRRLLGKFPFHLSIYNLVNPEKEKERKEKRQKKLDKINEQRRWKGKEPKKKFYFTEWLQNIGEAPVIYDSYLTSKTNKQFRLYMKNKGYYNANVSDTVIFKKKKAKVIYSVKTGIPYLYRRIEYKIEDAGLKQIMLEDSVSSLLKPGNLFDIDILQQERERITYLFKTKGYYSFIKEFIDYQIDTAITEHKADVIIRINNPVATNSFLSGNHKKFLLNDIYVFTNFDPKRSLQEKEAYYQVFDTLEYQGYYFVYEDKLAIKPQIILRAISLKKSDLYDIREVENTYNYLTSLKLYKLTNIVMSEVNDSVDSNDNSLLDCIIQLTPFTRQAYSVELEGTNTSGNLGIAANTKYQHKSLFRGGELFELNFKGALQAQTRIIESSDESGVTEYLPFNTLEVGPESSLKIPKLLIPFRMEEFTKKYHPKTSVLSAYNFQRRPEYTRSILTGKIGYFWSGAKNITHIINPLELNYIKLMNIDAQFQEMINKSNFGNSYKNQLITSANYNLAFTNQDIKKIRDFSYLKVGIETAGNMFSLYNKIGEKVKLENYYMILDVKYAQYFKFDFDYSFHKIINPENKIVYHGCAGLGLPYGNSDAMPFVKQYFAGGANSIRAWNVRTLGPGAFKNDDPNNQYPNQNSDMKLEANVEYRFNIIAMLEGALFVDAGNIWSVSKNDDRRGSKFMLNSFYKEIAAGAGLGVRLNLEFFIFRLDVGYKIADPSESEGKRIVIGRRPFGQNEIAWALGIGYPF